MSPYLPSDRWFLGDPDPQHIGRPFWVCYERTSNGSRFVQLDTWYGRPGGWGGLDQDTVHFRVVAYMRADVPIPYFL